MADTKNQPHSLKLEMSLSVWNVTDGFGEQAVYVSRTFPAYTVRVSDSVCLAVTGEFPDSVLGWVRMNGSLVRVSTGVINLNTCALSLSSMQSIVRTTSHTDTDSVLSHECRTTFLKKRLFNRKPDMPFPVLLWIRYDQNISNDLMTHIHQQVAVGSVSRHATMTKYERGSKLLWLPRLPKGINPQTPVNYDVLVLNITKVIPVLKGWCLSSVKTTCVWEWALIRPLMMKTRFRCCTAGLYLYQQCGEGWRVYCSSWHVKVSIKTSSFVFKSLVAKSLYACFTGNDQGFSHVYLCSAEF